MFDKVIEAALQRYDLHRLINRQRLSLFALFDLGFKTRVQIIFAQFEKGGNNQRAPSWEFLRD